MRNLMEGTRFANIFLHQGVKASIQQSVPADNFVMDEDMPFYSIFAPAGAIDILLPASNAANAGLMFLISNNSANAITFKTSADAAFTTAIVLAAQETSLLVCTGDPSAVLGWRAIGTASSA